MLIKVYLYDNASRKEAKTKSLFTAVNLETESWWQEGAQKWKALPDNLFSSSETHWYVHTMALSISERFDGVTRLLCEE